MAMDGLRKSASSRNLSQLAQQLRGLEPATPAKPQVQRPPRHTNVPTREIAQLTQSLRVRA
ncbi:hypothetical protein SPRG_07690 [Saprolegnia parasitica CBS 223.65]|uniref:Uncharacterized protein n=1 Tax=Saprolegnia parasitica (strain CBS 223.65) TaxID=695850 RepID=A0A067CJI3_SAPPC|nr:hypothetical protein SPRG_07690 [Saprolegnia parasitica CBS 223.65]KDO26977.1 hypothetical protein SPRG_07690 [Saprolegnia parasitica CBS 223.65]|eukprot:XP_012202358.1 hypothetical protein SPRG_07690 [Saprolegnia parasitica CBS 223.65]